MKRAALGWILSTGLVFGNLSFVMANRGLLDTYNLIPKDSTQAANRFDNLKDRIRIGGNVGAQFGTVTMVDISPNIAYHLTDNWRAGLSGTYRYLNFKQYDLITSIYGGGLFSQYQILPSIFAHAEYEVLNGPWDGVNRFNVTSLFVGGGYSGQVGGRLSTNFMILYNLNDSSFSPYTNPVIRAGFGLDL